MKFYIRKNMRSMSDKIMWGMTGKNISQDILGANQQRLSKTTMIRADLKYRSSGLETSDYHGFWGYIFIILTFHLEVISDLQKHCKIVQRIPAWNSHPDFPNVTSLPKKLYSL